MYLLKPCGDFKANYFWTYSHSTMYLLKRKEVNRMSGDEANSHSTMYLLKLDFERN